MLWDCMGLFLVLEFTPLEFETMFSVIGVPAFDY